MKTQNREWLRNLDSSYLLKDFMLLDRLVFIKRRSDQELTKTICNIDNLKIIFKCILFK